MAEVGIYLRIRTADGSQPYCKPVWENRKKLKPLWAFVDGKPQERPDGTYHLRFNIEGKRKWKNVGKDARYAYDQKEHRKWTLNYTQIPTAARIIAAITPTPAPGPDPNAGRKVIATSIKLYLADLEAAKRTRKTIQGTQRICHASPHRVPKSMLTRSPTTT